MKNKVNLDYGEFDPKSTGIYKIQIESHLYIGSAATGFEKRWRKHIKDLFSEEKHHSYLLQKWFNKFLCIDFAILEICKSENCIEREQYYIDILKPDMNICKVAGNSLGVKRTNETKEKLRQAHLGKKLSEESITKRTEKMIKKVYQFSLGGKYIREWNSIKEAGETLNISRASISKCSNNKMQFAGGFIWRKELVEVLPVKIGKSILQFTIKDELIKKWDGISQIEKETNFKRNNIYENLRGAKDVAYGFKWKYDK